MIEDFTFNSIKIKLTDKDEFHTYRYIYGQKLPFQAPRWEDYPGNDYFAEVTCYWFFKNNTKIGGAIMNIGNIGSIFTIPPYADLDELVKVATNYQISLKPKEGKVFSYDVTNEQEASYFKNGYKVNKRRITMMIPVQKYEIYWEDYFEVRFPKIEEAKELIKINLKAFKNATDNYVIENEKEEIENIQKDLRGINELKDLKNIFFLVIDKRVDKYVACINLCDWNHFPLIDNVAVIPEYQNQGIASRLIKQGITYYYKKAPMVRLFVTQGNQAENLYYNLGFKHGNCFSFMQYEI